MNRKANKTDVHGLPVGESNKGEGVPNVSAGAKVIPLPPQEPESHHDVYGLIWSQFSKDWKGSRSRAYSNLLQNLTKHAATLVPAYMTAKEHMAMVIEAATNIKGDERQEKEDPKDLVASWLRGDMDLSRIPLEGLKQ